jgi:16S rRNA processing protein RimM
VIAARPPGGTPTDLVALGVVRGAYGLRGWVRVAKHATDGSVLESVRRWWLTGRGDPKPLVLEQISRRGQALVAKWQGCEVKEAADALKGATVAVSRSDFPPLAAGEHYWCDLVGRGVVNREGRELGAVVALRSSGRGAQWLEVERQGSAAGKSKGLARMLIPLVEQYVDAVDTGAGVIRVDWQEDW